MATAPPRIAEERSALHCGKKTPPMRGWGWWTQVGRERVHKRSVQSPALYINFKFCAQGRLSCLVLIRQHSLNDLFRVSA
jgi:hypothetical protein